MIVKVDLILVLDCRYPSFYSIIYVQEDKRRNQRMCIRLSFYFFGKKAIHLSPPFLSSQLNFGMLNLPRK